MDDDSMLGEVLPPTTRLGRYTVLELLGVGGMGIVCTAYDPQLDRKVAIKVLRGSKRSHSSATAQARLMREAQALAKLSHPNIVSVHDVGTHEGRLYMAMEHIDGSSLDLWLKTRREWRTVVEVLVDAGRGLVAAHEADIVHRDFKPSNVLIGRDGRVCVVDFGLAKGPDPAGSQSLDPASLDGVDESIGEGDTHEVRLTEAGRLVGTPAYMAPEQFLGLGADARTDQFSFGVTLYEAVYGTSPFPSKSVHALIERVSQGDVAEPPRGSTVPSWLFRVIERMLQPRPEDRYPSMSAVLAALQADPARRRRRIAGAGAGVLLAVLSAVGVYRGVASAPTVCRGAAARLEGIWSPERKQQVEAAFMATEKPFADDAWQGTRTRLDHYTTRWIALHTEICEATNVRREQSEALMDVRMACLDRGHRELSALVDRLANADEAVVRRATRAVQDLDDIEACAGVRQDHAALDDPVLAAGVRDIEVWLAEAKALEHTGNPAQALTVAERALTRASALGHAPTLAWAQFHAARLRMSLSHDPQSVHRELVEVIDLAARTQQPDLEALAWTKLMMLEAGPLGRPDSAITLQLPARIAAERADDPVISASLPKTMGMVYGLAGDYDAALREYQTALERLERHHGPRHHVVASLWANLGGVYGNVRRYDEALAALDQAIAISEDLFGPDHPLLASALVNRGSVLTAKDDHRQARESYARALAIFEQVLPADHRRVLMTRIGLANAEQKLGRWARARAELEAVVPVLQGASTPDPNLLWLAHGDLGEVFEAMAKDADSTDGPEGERLWEQAREHYRRALESHRGRSDGKSLERRSRMERNLCNLERSRGRLDEALAHCEAAWVGCRGGDETGEYAREVLDLLSQVHQQRGDLDAAVAVLEEGITAQQEAGQGPGAAFLHLALAERLWAAGRRQAAVGQAGRARQLWLDAGERERVAQLDRWLGDHPAEP